ncbi:hypothetical protein EE612_041646 [Oryza sativa]|nr:hypothetical protein EE612_041646 [Oryza sativa]
MAQMLGALLLFQDSQMSTMTRMSYSLLLPILCPLILLLLFRCYAYATRSGGLLDKLPSPPGRLPLIGHMHLIGSFPHMSLRDLATKHGPDLMLLHLGTVPTLVVSSSRMAQVW